MNINKHLFFRIRSVVLFLCTEEKHAWVVKIESVFYVCTRRVLCLYRGCVSVTVGRLSHSAQEIETKLSTVHMLWDGSSSHPGAAKTT